jgi:hypothetical protein
MAMFVSGSYFSVNWPMLPLPAHQQWTKLPFGFVGYARPE